MKHRPFLLQNVWRICNLFMSLFFGLATYVQINDPDAGLWMVGYAIPACLTPIVSWHPHITGITDIFQQEEGREFSGLMLTVTWLLLCRHSGRDGIGIIRLSTAVGITVFPFVAWLYYYINTELRSNWPSHCKTAL
ncbi:transmembrane protein 220 isoform X2 [Alosa sapidissima]|uniref:transmembrane protein 220 isoform X2 n=1 Tax=Alosa sapidissima TaxID=34773 RepID=UPI001C0963E7|nr:transmembrane protein 220 isoform X2 [Alosa sapidissima]